MMEFIDREIPDFIGIGAPRSGTIWLWRNLKNHPDIWMSPRKKLHYFDRAVEYPSPSHLACRQPIKRMFGMQPYTVKYRMELFKATISNILHPSSKSLNWSIN